jgi:hypothetical protein
MLSRPEIGTREHILLWLASKPPREKFVYESVKECACGQYSAHVYDGDALRWTNRHSVWRTTCPPTSEKVRGMP